MAEVKKETTQMHYDNIKVLADLIKNDSLKELSVSASGLAGSVKSLKRALEEKLADFAKAKAESEAVLQTEEENGKSVVEEVAKTEDEAQTKTDKSAMADEHSSESQSADEKPAGDAVAAKVADKADDKATQKSKDKPAPKEFVVTETRPSWVRRPTESERNLGKPAQTGKGEYKPRVEYKSEYKPAGDKKRPVAAPYVAPAVVQPDGNKRGMPNKKKSEKTYDEKRPAKRAPLIRNNVDIDDFDENKTGYRKMRPAKKNKADAQATAIKIERAVINTEIIPLKVLSEKLGITAAEITKRLFKEGIMKTINDSIDFDTAAFIAADLGIELELKLDKTAEDVLSEGFEGVVDDEASLLRRPPVVTVMGHVDHGKTSLLDRIRKTNVTAGEAGGITQHIGAYQVTVGGEVITFLDTPGHAAFTAMRARGAQATDIAILVVAADDGIMPQTIEAINHAKAANVPIIVAINKIDKPESNIDRIKTQLTENGLLPEEWGGDTILCPVSAKTGQGMDALLENVNVVAEMAELKANPNRKAKGVVIEAKLDQSRGPIATILVQNGTLKIGDSVLVGMVTGKVRAMTDDKGRKVTSAGPSTPVSIMGLDEVPNAGDILYAVEQEKLVKMVAEERKNRERENMIKASSKVSLDDVFSKISEGEMKGLNLIVKADVQGSVEAVKQSLEKLSNEEVKVNVIHAAAGAIKESDIMLAESSNAIIIGFNVRPDSNAKQVAERSGVDIKLYRVIYEAIEDVEKALKGMLAPKFSEVYLGKAEVREVFKITGVGQVAGCYVVEGKIQRNGKLRIYRDDVMITEGNVLQLKRFKDDVKEVAQGFECGMSIERFNDIKIGDYIECYLVEETKA